MRLWSLHPACLDGRGLCACWREALLARKVLQGLTRGYREHPQLQRFRGCGAPLEAIETYLYYLFLEAGRRGYSFSSGLVNKPEILPEEMIEVSSGQLEFECRHLREKIQRRNPAELNRLDRPRPHPLFRLVSGPPASWERGR